MSDIHDCIDLVGGFVSGAIFIDDHVYQQELHHLRQRTWVFLTHDSMTPKHNDYRQTYIGEVPVNAVHQKNGEVKDHLLLLELWRDQRVYDCHCTAEDRADPVRVPSEYGSYALEFYCHQDLVHHHGRLLP